jgi:hypothetical protein
MAARVTSPETAVDIFLTPGQNKVVARRYGVTPIVVREIKRRNTHRAATDACQPEFLNALLIVFAASGSGQ